MNGETIPNHELVANRLAQRLQTYAKGLGLDDAGIRQIVEDVIADLPEAEDIDRQTEARRRIFVAAL